MINEGAWTNARNLLTDSNMHIVSAAAELMANLALTETIMNKIDDEKAKVEIDAMVCLLGQANDNMKLANAILSFFANTIHLPQP
jgi:hypothetical protein